jgi:hypothetical protein
MFKFSLLLILEVLVTIPSQLESEMVRKQTERISIEIHQMVILTQNSPAVMSMECRLLVVPTMVSGMIRQRSTDCMGFLQPIVMLDLLQRPALIRMK